MPRRSSAARDAVTQIRPITVAELPPGLLATPPRAPFVTTPLPPSNNPGNSIVPEANGPRQRSGRTQQHTPTANGPTQNQGGDQPGNTVNGTGTSALEIGQTEGLRILESAHYNAADARHLTGLRDISSLATWTLSSSKPGCALPQLRHPNPAHFWQSDGPQPHTLTLHFFKLVAVVKMRIYLDFELDESYTPTKMRFYAGMSESGLVEFGNWETHEVVNPETGAIRNTVETVRGWIDVSLKGVGGGDIKHHEKITSPQDGVTSKELLPQVNVYKHRNHAKARKGFGTHDINIPESVYDADMNDCTYTGGDVLKAMVVQVRICENHQNGKDTHVRGFQVFARDEVGEREMRPTVSKSRTITTNIDDAEEQPAETDVVGLQPADWMGDPEIR